MERKEGVLAVSEQEKKQKEIQRLKNELDDLGYRAERKARELDATVFEPLMKRILFAIQDVAKEQKFDIILRGEAVLYGSSAADITDAVIEKLNREAATGTSQPTDATKSASAAEKKANQDKTTPPAESKETKSESAEAGATPTPSSTSEPPQAPESQQPGVEKTATPKETRAPAGAKPKRPVDRQPD